MIIFIHLENFVKIYQKCWFFGKKNRHFLYFTPRFQKKPEPYEITQRYITFVWQNCMVQELFWLKQGYSCKGPSRFSLLFYIYIYKGKMAEKRLKMGIKTYINGQNDLKFGHNMYDDKFQQFLKLVKKLCFFGKIIGSF